MGRIIKFKAKRLGNGKWVEGLPCKNCYNQTCILVLHSKDGGEYGFIPVDPSTVCQYTGMHDKNGKEIWEGDIVKEVWTGHDCIYEVVYIPDEGAFAFKNLYNENDIQPYCNIVELVLQGSKFDRKEEK